MKGVALHGGAPLAAAARPSIGDMKDRLAPVWGCVQAVRTSAIRCALLTVMMIGVRSFGPAELRGCLREAFGAPCRVDGRAGRVANGARRHMDHLVFI